MRKEEIETDDLDSEVSFKNHIKFHKDVLELQHNELEFSTQGILLNKMESEIENTIVPAPILSISENQDILKPELIQEVRFEKSEEILSGEIEKKSATKQESPKIASSTIERDVKIHTNEKPFPCNFCGKKFARKRAMKRHEIIHSKIENIETPESKKTTPTSATLETCTNDSFVKSEGQSVLDNQDISKPELIQEVRFEKSEEIESGEIEKNSAAKQEVPIITSSTIKRQIHTVDKPFPCNFCGKKFASKKSMKRHETIHSKIENIVKSEAQSNLHSMMNQI